MTDRYPTATQSVYIDLRTRHLDQRVNELGGTPVLRELRNKKYWYAQIAIKGRKIQRYIGPDTEDVRAQIDRAKWAEADARKARRSNRALVRQLQSMGGPTLEPNPGSVLRAMAKVGVFRLGGTLIGTHAFKLYALELGVHLSDASQATQDVDIAAFQRLSLAIGDRIDASLGESLGALGLEAAPSLDPGDPTRWIAKGGGADVEFLSPSFSDTEGPVRLEAFDGWAQGLHFLNYPIAEPIPAVALYLDGVLVQVPRPERYAIHKLIVAQRRSRTNRAKARKDLDQARDLVEVLAIDRPYDLEDAYLTALNGGPKWRRYLSASLKQRPDIRARLNFGDAVNIE